MDRPSPFFLPTFSPPIDSQRNVTGKSASRAALSGLRKTFVVPLYGVRVRVRCLGPIMYEEIVMLDRLKVRHRNITRTQTRTPYNGTTNVFLSQERAACDALLLSAVSYVETADISTYR